jgi:hypothetical protein
MFCGIDWSDDHHDVAVVDNNGAVIAQLRIGNDAGGFGQLLETLAELGSGSAHEVPVAIETAKGLLVASLIAGGWTVFPIKVRSPATGRVGMCDPAPLAMCAQSWPITCASWSMRVGGRYWSVTRAPKGASASSMALVMAAGAPIIPPSPMPRKSFSPGLSVWR